MPSRSRTFLLALLLILLSPAARADFPLKIAFQPRQQNIIPFPGDGKLHISYEMFVTNFSSKPVEITKLDVSATGANSPLRTYEAADLAAIFSSVGANYNSPQQPLLTPGAAAVLYLFLDFDPAALPKAVQTEITVHAQGEPGTSQLVTYPHAVTIGPETPFRISPPLRGENWFSPNAPSNFSIHRRVLLVWNGAVSLTEEFAVDWVRINPTGASFQGDRSKNESYLAYRAEILAAAPGRVVDLLDGVPENVPLQPPSVPLTVATIGGNYVILDHGNNRFSFYAHLIPGSLRVKRGDTVAAGQVLGLLGNSGNSSEPHLHFHVMDGPVPLGPRGIPFTLDRFTLKPYTFTCAPGGDGCDPTDPPARVTITASRPVTNSAFLNNSLANF